MRERLDVEAIAAGETQPYDDVRTFFFYRSGDRGHLVRTLNHGRCALVVWERDKAKLPRCVIRRHLRLSTQD